MSVDTISHAPKNRIVRLANGACTGVIGDRVCFEVGENISQCRECVLSDILLCLMSRLVRSRYLSDFHCSGAKPFDSCGFLWNLSFWWIKIGLTKTFMSAGFHVLIFRTIQLIFFKLSIDIF